MGLGGPKLPRMLEGVGRRGCGCHTAVFAQAALSLCGAVGGSAIGRKRALSSVPAVTIYLMNSASYAGVNVALSDLLIVGNPRLNNRLNSPQR